MIIFLEGGGSGRILKIALNKLTEGNDYVECIENHLSYDYNTWKLNI